MTMTETRVYMQLADTREEALQATLTTKTTLAKACKAGRSLKDSDVIGHAELLTMTETLKGSMFLSPSGSSVYVLKPETRKIADVSTKMLSIKHNVPLAEVLSFEVTA